MNVNRTLLAAIVTSAAVLAPAAAAPASAAPPTLVAQINLVAPGEKATPTGVAEVLKAGSGYRIVIDATGVPPGGTHSAYGVWLAHGPHGARLLGFFLKPVLHRIQVAGSLPADFRRYRELLITLETHAHPRTPGRIVLIGRLRTAALP